MKSHKPILREFVTSGLNGATVDIICRLVAPDYRDHSIYYSRSSRRPQMMPTRRHLLAFVEYLAAPDVDLKIGLEDLVEEGDKIAYRLITKGTIEVPSRKVPLLEKIGNGPAYIGHEIDNASKFLLRHFGMGTARFRGGVLVENWGVHAVI